MCDDRCYLCKDKSINLIVVLSGIRERLTRDNDIYFSFDYEYVCDSTSCQKKVFMSFCEGCNKNFKYFEDVYKSVSKNCKMCYKFLCPSCSYSIKKTRPCFLKSSYNFNRSKNKITSCKDCEDIFCKTCYEDHCNNYKLSCSKCQNYECIHSKSNKISCPCGDCNDHLCEKCYYMYNKKLIFEKCYLCSKMNCYKYNFHCHNCDNRICKDCMKKCNTCDYNYYCLKCYDDHILKEKHCVLCNDQVCKGNSKKHERLDVYICNNHNHSFVDNFCGEKKCFIKGCQNTHNNSLITCVNVRPDLYYDHYKLICLEHYKYRNTPLVLETKTRKYCRISNDYYDVHKTLKCKMCRFHYHSKNMVAKSIDKLKNNNVCACCYLKVYKIQKFISKHLFNPEYLICRKFLNKKMDKLKIIN